MVDEDDLRENEIGDYIFSEKEASWIYPAEFKENDTIWHVIKKSNDIVVGDLRYSGHYEEWIFSPHSANSFTSKKMGYIQEQVDKLNSEIGD